MIDDTPTAKRMIENAAATAQQGPLSSAVLKQMVIGLRSGERIIAVDADWLIGEVEKLEKEMIAIKVQRQREINDSFMKQRRGS